MLKILGSTKPQAKDPNDTSQFGEQEIIQKIFGKTSDISGLQYVIDIGASNGLDASNTYPLFKNGARGLLVEPDPEKFASLADLYKQFDVNLFRGYATPENIINIFKSCHVPREPTFMNFDIDSYDYFVLQTILEEYRPKLISVEINEKIPPPLKFAVLFNPDHFYNGDHFYGMSISALGDLCIKYSYDIIFLNYINTFIVPHEKNRLLPPLSPEEAFNSGYRDRKDRKEKFPWNSNMEKLLYMNPDEAQDFLLNFFSRYRNRYVLSY